MHKVKLLGEVPLHLVGQPPVRELGKQSVDGGDHEADGVDVSLRRLAEPPVLNLGERKERETGGERRIRGQETCLQLEKI